MHYYLDAYNLLFHLTSTTHCLESERQQLIDMIAHLIAPRKLKVTLVFDGSGSIEYPQKFVTQDVEIVYTTGGQNADNYILEKVSPENIVLQLL